MNFKSLFVSAACVIASAVCANAAVYNFDNGVVELGKIYNVPQYCQVEATLTAPATGKLLQDGCPEIKFTELGDGTFVGFNGSYGSVYEWEVVEGTTYHLSADFVMNAGKVVFQMVSDINVQLNEVLPREGSMLYPQVNYTGNVLLYFNASVKAESAVMKCGNESAALVVPDGYANSMAINVVSAIKLMQANGAISEDGGETLVIEIYGVADSEGKKLNGDGTISLSYVAGPKEIDIVSSNINSFGALQSYYPAGDPRGILTFNFSGKVKPGAVFSLSCGNPEADIYYYEDINAKVDGEVVTVDLTGKLRQLNTFIAAQGFDAVAGKLYNLFDENGLPAAGSGQGNAGSYSFSLAYNYIQPVEIASEFVPATGSSLAGVDNIEIWFNHADMVSFDGVKFTYVENGQLKNVVVDKSDLQIVADNNEVEINVAVPAEVKGKSDITVALDNLVSYDGYDHNSQIMAEYDKFVVKLISPITPGNAYYTTGDEDFVFTVNTPYEYIRYDFYNEEWAYGTGLNLQDDGTYTAYNGNYTCYAGRENYMLVRAYDSEAEYREGKECKAKYTFLFDGLTKPFEYSTYEFVGITPQDGSEIYPYEDFCFTVEFDGLVSIDADKSGIVLGFGAGVMPFAKIEPAVVDSELPEGLASTWLLYPSYNYLSSNDAIAISIYAYDQDGMLIRGNMGGDEWDYLSFYYTIYNPSSFAEINVYPEAGTKLDELNSISVTADGKTVGPNYNYNGIMPAIYTMFMETVYEFTYEDIEVYSEEIQDESGETVLSEISSVILHIDPAITENGTYVVYLPENFFIVGDQFDTKGSAEFWGSYILGAEETPGDYITLTVNPEAGTVAALDKIVVDCIGENLENAVANYDQDKPITIEDGLGNVVYSMTPAEADNTMFDWNAWKFMGLTLEPNITEAGTYVLTIPDKFLTFYYGEAYSEELVAVYTISGSDSIKAIIVNGASRYDVYNVKGQKVLSTSNAAELSTLRPGIYVINGQKVMVK